MREAPFARHQREWTGENVATVKPLLKESRNGRCQINIRSVARVAGSPVVDHNAKYIPERYWIPLTSKLDQDCGQYKERAQSVPLNRL
jgi:hypothetical protein